MDFISTINYIKFSDNGYNVHFKDGKAVRLTEKQFIKEDEYYSGELTKILRREVKNGKKKQERSDF